MNSNARLPQETFRTVRVATGSPVSWPGHVLRLAWVGCLALVVVGSLLPDNSLPMRALTRLNISDKIQHFGAYAVLAFLPGIHERPRIPRSIALGLIGLGVLLEFAQALAARDFEFGDMIADTAGVFIGIGAAWPLREYVGRQLSLLGEPGVPVDRRRTR